MKVAVLLLTQVIMIIFRCSMSAKVIVLSQNINSHLIYHAKIARLLADEGHVVDMLLPSSAKLPDALLGSGVHILEYQVSTAVSEANITAISQLLLDCAMANSAVDKFLKNLAFVRSSMSLKEEECRILLNDNNIKKHIERAAYDVAIVDLLGLKCHCSLIHDKNVPIIIYGRLALEWQFRVPVLPSFVPTLFSPFADRMSFVERLTNSVIFLGSHVAFFVMSSEQLPDTSPPVYVTDMIQRHSLVFDLDDVSIAYPKPTMPNVISVGDAIPEQGRALTGDISQFVEEAKHGVVIVSFGSYFNFLAPDIIDKFCATFKAIPQKVIWKLSDKRACDADPNKVLLLDWLPQNDLLSHENVKLFISHCGINSILESVYHRTPIIGFPIAIDQPYNARRLQSRGLGYEMKLSEFSSDELTRNIAAILSDENVLKNIERASYLLRNKPDAPAKRISYWVQHIATYGDKHLKTNAFELNVIQFYCLDVLFVLFLVITIACALCFYCLKSMFCCLRNRCQSKKSKAD